MSAIQRNGAAALAAVLIIPALLVVFDRKSPIEVLGEEVDPHVVTAGDCASIKWRIRVNRVCPLTIDSRLETERGNVWPQSAKAVEGYARKGEVLVIAHEFCVPHALKSADAVYRQTTYYHCWPYDSWWPIVVDMPPASLHITEAGAKP